VLSAHLRNLCSGDETWRQLSALGFELAQSMNLKKQQEAIQFELSVISGS